MQPLSLSRLLPGDVRPPRNAFAAAASERRSLCFVLAILGVMTFGLRTVGAQDADGFRPLFDGKTLAGWKARDMSYWSVEDGAITAKITPEHPLKVNQYLVWRDAMDDFELKLTFRITGSPGTNSGFQFRSRLLPDGDMAGYQMDNNRDTPWLARLYEEHGRDTLAFRGKQTLIDRDGKQTQSDLPEAGGAPWFQLDRWHEYHLICQGPHLVLKVDGRLAAEVIDEDAKHYAPSGLLGLQLHSGPPMTVQFKNIRLKTLKKAAAAPAVIRDKTLVAWIAPANLAQRGGSVLTLDDQQGHFDGIVFGELTPGKWMVGSDGFRRTQKEQANYPTETADAKTPLQVAVVYRGSEIAIYRNAKLCSRYSIEQPQVFGQASAVVIGLRHLDAADRACFAGTVDDARVYAMALSAEQIAALRPNTPSQPKPLAWWTFDGGVAADRMGLFSEVELVGDARVADGKLQLGGRESYLVATRKTPERYVSPIHYRPRRGCLADTIPFFWKGAYHVFYLQGGVGKVPWKHIVSTDLVRWKELPDALLPDGDPNGCDGEHMFTGSVTEKDGAFHIFYTGWNPRNPKGRETICHATSPDLIRWTKHPEDHLVPDGVHYANPKERDFRDAFVFWNNEEQQHWMVLCANSLQGGGPGLAVSKDLKTWRQIRALDAPNQECPDLFKIGDTWYLIGADTYRYGKNPHGPFKEPAFNNVIDRPFIYAGKRMFDGQRHIWTGWLWDRVPNTDHGNPQWGGTQCLPRELYAGPGGQLYCKPAAEIPAVFRHTALDLAKQPALAKQSGSWNYTQAGLVGHSGQAGQNDAMCAWDVPDHYMLECMIQLDPKAVFTLTSRQTELADSGYRLVLNPQKQEAEIASQAFRHPRRIELDASKPIRIQAFVQGSMIEAFVNDQYAFSCRGYDFATGRLAMSVRGGEVRIMELKVKTP
jgi:sucrose-6-phosphate hydrolase SacC (GH32 family)